MYYDKYLHITKSKKTFEIYVKKSGNGNVHSSSATADAIQDIKPDYLFYIGIAGKLKDVDIGAVVVADTVEHYEPAKDTDTGSLMRIFQGHADNFLLSKASSIITDGKQIWQEQIIVKRHPTFPEPIDTIGRIATGEKVLSSITSDLYKQIRERCSASVAVECEGGGFYHACNQKAKPGLLIRGISDKLKDKNFVEEYNSQPYAASCASAFLFELIEQL
jgi:nucleoside phosphorylase